MESQISIVVTKKELIVLTDSLNIYCNQIQKYDLIHSDRDRETITAAISVQEKLRVAGREL